MTTIRTLTTGIITGFEYKDNGSLKVYFRSHDGENASKYSAFAHPALKVSPYIGKAQEIKFAVEDGTWKLIQPFPTAEELAAYDEAKKKRYSSSEATEAELALLATF